MICEGRTTSGQRAARRREAARPREPGIRAGPAGCPTNCSPSRSQRLAVFAAVGREPLDRSRCSWTSVVLPAANGTGTWNWRTIPVEIRRRARLGGRSSYVFKKIGAEPAHEDRRGPGVHAAQRRRHRDAERLGVRAAAARRDPPLVDRGPHPGLLDDRADRRRGACCWRRLAAAMMDPLAFGIAAPRRPAHAAAGRDLRHHVAELWRARFVATAAVAGCCSASAAGCTRRRSSGATSSWSRWAPAGWAKSGARGIGCWRATRPSSWYGPSCSARATDGRSKARPPAVRARGAGDGRRSAPRTPSRCSTSA